MSTDHAHTSFATDARTLKAVRVEAHLRTLGYAAADVDPLDPRARRLVEKAAGVRPCSEETWALVRRLLGGA